MRVTTVAAARAGATRQYGGLFMAKTAKRGECGRESIRRLSDSEILLFVSRTLQPQLDGADAPNVFGKLQSLKNVLAQLDAALPEWPDGAAKERMRDALIGGRSLLAQIIDDLNGATGRAPAVGTAKSA
jgi:hypothetical protein